MQTGIKGRSVLVAEVGDDLAKSTALAFAREGANLLLGAVHDTDLDETVREASALGARVVSGVVDFRAEDQVRAFVQRGFDEFGYIDVLLKNVTCPASVQSFEAMSFDNWRSAIHLQITGSIFVCRAVLPGMIERRWGRIIHYIGLSPFLGADPATSAAHLGIVGLTRGVATLYGKYHITANCVGHSGIEGIDNDSFPPKMTDPLPCWGTSQEISSLAVYLASEDARHITGQCYLVNGGKCFL
jgi:NAD(P)-dependent dehydrogenase (short-subunit alcohol dehydrogenase family)